MKQPLEIAKKSYIIIDPYKYIAGSVPVFNQITSLHLWLGFKLLFFSHPHVYAGIQRLLSLYLLDPAIKIRIW